MCLISVLYFRLVVCCCCRRYCCCFLSVILCSLLCFQTPGSDLIVALLGTHSSPRSSPVNGGEVPGVSTQRLFSRWTGRRPVGTSRLLYGALRCRVRPRSRSVTTCFQPLSQESNAGLFPGEAPPPSRCPQPLILLLGRGGPSASRSLHVIINQCTCEIDHCTQDPEGSAAFSAYGEGSGRQPWTGRVQSAVSG